MDKLDGRNLTLDFFRGIACILVVFIHIQFPQPFGKYVEAVAKSAVPFFFMTGGFFLNGSSKEEQEKKIKKRIRYLLVLSLVYFGVYLLNDLIRCAFGDPQSNLTLQGYMERMLSIGTIVNFFVFNVFPVLMPMGWYLLAALYAYIVCFLINRYSSLEKWYKCIPILFAGYYAIRILIPVACGVTEDSDWMRPLSRNWLFDALPFMLLGNLFYRYQSKIRLLLDRKTGLFYIILFSFVSIFEYILLSAIGWECDYHISNIIVVMFVFSVGIIEPDGFHNKVVTEIGRKYSAFVYIMHGFVMGAVHTVVNAFSLSNEVIQWFLPVIVVAVTLIAGVFYYELINKIKGGK